MRFDDSALLAVFCLHNLFRHSFGVCSFICKKWKVQATADKWASFDTRTLQALRFDFEQADNEVHRCHIPEHGELQLPRIPP